MHHSQGAHQKQEKQPFPHQGTLLACFGTRTSDFAGTSPCAACACSQCKITDYLSPHLLHVYCRLQTRTWWIITEQLMCGNLLPCCTLSVCLNIQTLHPLLAMLAESCLHLEKVWGKWGSKTRSRALTPPISQLLTNKLSRRSWSYQFVLWKPSFCSPIFSYFVLHRAWSNSCRSPQGFCPSQKSRKAG